METQKIIAASQNPAKIKAIDSAFKEVFPEDRFLLQGVSVNSGVDDQPLSDQETRRGAYNRINQAKKLHPNANFYVGIEAGIERNFTFAWVIIKDGNEKYGESRSAGLMLPKIVLKGIEQGKELGEVMDEVFNTSNVKEKEGATGLLTNQCLSRSAIYHQSLILALVPFLNSHESF